MAANQFTKQEQELIRNIKSRGFSAEDGMKVFNEARKKLNQSSGSTSEKTKPIGSSIAENVSENFSPSNPISSTIKSTTAGALDAISPDEEVQGPISLEVGNNVGVKDIASTVGKTVIGPFKGAASGAVEGAKNFGRAFSKSKELAFSGETGSEKGMGIVGLGLTTVGAPIVGPASIAGGAVGGAIIDTISPLASVAGRISKDSFINSFGEDNWRKLASKGNSVLNKAFSLWEKTPEPFKDAVTLSAPVLDAQIGVFGAPKLFNSYKKAYSASGDVMDSMYESALTTYVKKSGADNMSKKAQNELNNLYNKNQKDIEDAVFDMLEESLEPDELKRIREKSGFKTSEKLSSINFREPGDILKYEKETGVNVSMELKDMYKTSKFISLNKLSEINHTRAQIIDKTNQFFTDRSIRLRDTYTSLDSIDPLSNYNTDVIQNLRTKQLERSNQIAFDEVGTRQYEAIVDLFELELKRIAGQSDEITGSFITKENLTRNDVWDARIKMEKLVREQPGTTDSNGLLKDDHPKVQALKDFKQVTLDYLDDTSDFRRAGDDLSRNTTAKEEMQELAMAKDSIEKLSRVDPPKNWVANQFHQASRSVKKVIDLGLGGSVLTTLTLAGIFLGSGTPAISAIATGMGYWRIMSFKPFRQARIKQLERIRDLADENSTTPEQFQRFIKETEKNNPNDARMLKDYADENPGSPSEAITDEIEAISNIDEKKLRKHSEKMEEELNRIMQADNPDLEIEKLIQDEGNTLDSIVPKSSTAKVLKLKNTNISSAGKVNKLNSELQDIQKDIKASEDAGQNPTPSMLRKEQRLLNEIEELSPEPEDISDLGTNTQ